MSPPSSVASDFLRHVHTEKCSALKGSHATLGPADNLPCQVSSAVQRNVVTSDHMSWAQVVRMKSLGGAFLDICLSYYP